MPSACTVALKASQHKIGTGAENLRTRGPEDPRTRRPEKTRSTFEIITPPRPWSQPNHHITRHLPTSHPQTHMPYTHMPYTHMPYTYMPQTHMLRTYSIRTCPRGGPGWSYSGRILFLARFHEAWRPSHSSRAEPRQSRQLR